LVVETAVGPLAGLDGRAGTFAFSNGHFTFDEAGNGLRPIKVLRTDGNLGPIDVVVTPSGVSATPGADISNNSVVLSFADQEISQTIDVASLILDDDQEEGVEVVELSLSLAPGTPATALLGAVSSAQIEILDNDSAGSIQFADASYRFIEGQSTGAVIIERVGGTHGAVSVALATVQGSSTATPGVDFSLLTTELTFEDGDLRRRVVMDIFDDNQLEGDEVITLVLSIADSDDSSATIGERNTMQIVLESEDINTAPGISLIEDQQVLEDGVLKNVNFTVSDDYTPLEDLVVRVSSDNPHLVSNFGSLVQRGDNPEDRTLSITPVKQAFGQTLITVSVSDGQLTTSTTFVLEVIATDDAPVISEIPERISAIGQSVIVPFTIDDLDDGAEDLVVFISTQTTHYLSSGQLVISGWGKNRELIINRNGDAQGIGSFRLFVIDQDGLMASRDFEIDFGGAVEPPAINLTVVNSANVELTWEGDFRLFFTDALGQPFQEVVGAQSPYTAPMEQQGFYKLVR